MSVDNSYKLEGVVEGVYYGQNDRVDELNSRIGSRQFSDSPLQPNFTPRPVPTKYARFPIIDRKKPVKEPVVPYLDYCMKSNFNPGNARAPPSGYSRNVNVETILRNQTAALQHADQSVYVPSRDSDLYNVSIPSAPSVQPYPLLFQQFNFDQASHPNVSNNYVGNQQFFNHTRTQLRGNGESLS